MSMSGGLITNVIGIDEVGRGSWAGPLLVVAARPRTQLPHGITDSKKITRLRRQSLLQGIIEACDLGEGWVQPEEIDELGMTAAMRLGVSRALLGIAAQTDEAIIIDGLINYVPTDYTRVECIAKADGLHLVVGAASIYAKVVRDAYMARVARFYPLYAFEKHVGYGTKLHRTLLSTHGVSPLHRKSFAPVRAFL